MGLVRTAHLWNRQGLLLQKVQRLRHAFRNLIVVLDNGTALEYRIPLVWIIESKILEDCNVNTHGYDSGLA